MKVSFVCFLKMILIGHVLDYVLDHVLDHMIIDLVTTALHYLKVFVNFE